jgi:hypothetical protein
MNTEKWKIPFLLWIFTIILIFYNSFLDSFFYCKIIYILAIINFIYLIKYRLKKLKLKNQLILFPKFKKFKLLINQLINKTFK